MTGGARTLFKAPRGHDPGGPLGWIFARVLPEPNSGCWLWENGIDRHGYASAQLRGRARRLALTCTRCHPRTADNLAKGECLACRKLLNERWQRRADKASGSEGVAGND